MFDELKNNLDQAAEEAEKIRKEKASQGSGKRPFMGYMTLVSRLRQASMCCESIMAHEGTAPQSSPDPLPDPAVSATQTETGSPDGAATPAT